MRDGTVTCAVIITDQTTPQVAVRHVRMVLHGILLRLGLGETICTELCIDMPKVQGQ